MTCASCGRDLERGARWCGACGRRQSARLALLSETLRAAPLDWRRALELVAAIADAVADARARGTTVAGFEPASFLLEHAVAGWVATWLDGEIPSNEPRDTEERPQMRWAHGPFDYFSPERLMGKPLAPASDVYTLGVIAYELATGEQPFAEARGPAGLITAMLKQAPIAPSTRRPDAAIPSAVDALLVACLDKRPTGRPADARAFADAARAVIASEPAPSGPPPLPRRPSRPRPAARQPFRATAREPAGVRVVAALPCGAPSCTIGHRLNAAPDGSLVGAWLHLDHFDSAVSRRPDRQHPHVGIASVCYLFDGRIRHRDSLGKAAKIKRGELGWLVAGRGAVHCERDDSPERVHGVSLWAALPRPNEDDAPTFEHYRAGALPSVVIGGARVRVVIGEGFGARSPVATAAPLALFDVRLPARAELALPSPRHHGYQRAVYVVAGAAEIAGVVVAARHLAIIPAGAAVGMRAANDGAAHAIVLGSAPLVGPRHGWWLFSASSKQRLADARRRYANGELGSVPGERDLPPLPAH